MENLRKWEKPNSSSDTYLYGSISHNARTRARTHTHTHTQGTDETIEETNL